MILEEPLAKKIRKDMSPIFMYKSEKFATEYIGKNSKHFDFLYRNEITNKKFINSQIRKGQRIVKNLERISGDVWKEIKIVEPNIPTEEEALSISTYNIINSTTKEIIRSAIPMLIKTFGFHNKKSFPAIYEAGYITDKEIKNEIEDGVIAKYKIDLNELFKEKRFRKYADDLINVDCFAYGLKKSKATEFHTIPFGHGMTLNSFLKQYYNQNLISNIQEKLFDISKK